MHLKPKNIILTQLLMLLFIFLSVSASFAGAATYIYDNTNRLIRVEYGDGTSVNYIYDSAGNLISRNVTYKTENLSVSKSGTGTGLIRSADTHINCGDSCNYTYNYGDSTILTATPDTGNTFVGWSGDCSGTGTCSLSMTANKNAIATFDITAFIITAIAGQNGSIAPSGSIAVAIGASQTYTITPGTGYQISDILVDGVSVGAVSSYTFNNVTAPHTISATFAINAASIVNTSPAKLWIGLKNSDDQGTQFDLRTELYINGVQVSEGETLCITGVTRNPSYAKEVTVPFNPITNGTYVPGDILSLKVLTRIGTTPDGQKCSGPGGSHNNAVGLRLYYDSPDRPSRFGYETVANAMQDLFLHSSGANYFLDNVQPTGTAKYKDSTSVNYSGGNPWMEIGTWTMMLQ